jgi:hypothetical protein
MSDDNGPMSARNAVTELGVSYGQIIKYHGCLPWWNYRVFFNLENPRIVDWNSLYRVQYCIIVS